MNVEPEEPGLRQDGTWTILLYAQDSKGMGTIARSLTIARHLLTAYPDSTAHIATESPLTTDTPLPDRCHYIQLPTHLGTGPTPRTEAEDESFDQHLSDDPA